MSLPALGLYLAAINLVTFAAFWSDKRAAIRRERRIPERSLLLMTALGGWIGALCGQHLLRHKTRKEPFRTQLYGIIAAELAALTVWLVAGR
ncbi:MAG TPA: DUF1294 domain-containing protein [Caulobacteraceae bacterium]|nr:DUF1294 domain-containing protein [Caulobacteraceae bacterium]